MENFHPTGIWQFLDLITNSQAADNWIITRREILAGEAIVALILVIEDAMLSRKMICRALQKEGYTTIEASNGFEGIEMARTQNPKCIILDMLMPDMDGREVLKHLQDQSIRIPVIVVTADIQKTTRQQCLELGALTVLNKIVEQNELCDWVEKALSLNQENS